MQEINQSGNYLKLTYNGKDISADITPHLVELNYTDNVSGMADDLDITLEDADGKWLNEWYPQKGAVLTLEMGSYDKKVIRPNNFELDEITASGSKNGGDVVTIKALSAGIVKPLNTKRSYAHENKTLGEIVRTIAAKYGLTVVGTIENIVIGRVTQHREKDLTFLARLADEYGYAFSVKGNKLSFIKLTSLEAAGRVAVIDKTDVVNYRFRDKSHSVYNRASVKSHNPNKNKTVKAEYKVTQQANNDGLQFSYLEKADSALEVRGKTENEAQANVKAEAALHKVNSLQQTGYIDLPGNTLLLAGVNVELTGFGACSGIWNILKSSHSMDKSGGYITSLELKRIVPPTQSGSAKKAKQSKPANPEYKTVPILNGDGLQFNTLVAKQDGVRNIPIPIKK